MTLYAQLAGIDSIVSTTMWQVVLLGSTIVFRGVSLINLHDLDDRNMRFNYIISSILADVTLVSLLFWFTPGGQYFVGKGWTILAVFVAFKGLFYLMNYYRSTQNAKEINARLAGMDAK